MLSAGVKMINRNRPTSIEVNLKKKQALPSGTLQSKGKQTNNYDKILQELFLPKIFLQSQPLSGIALGMRQTVVNKTNENPCPVALPS